MENVLASPRLHHPLYLPMVRSRRAQLWTGRVLTGLVATFLLLDGAAKLLQLAPVVEATHKLGFAITAIRPMGVLLVVSTLLYLIPRLQMVGAVLLTAYLGGATATLVHAGTPFWFPVAMGVILWIAYYLRSLPLRSFLSSIFIPSAR